MTIKVPYKGVREFDPINEKLDLLWGGGQNSDQRFNNYYDYYFSGEDIRVFIDGLFGPNDELDIVNFAFNVRQEKQPLYGFWSYNYDAVMMGTRIITGEISIFTRYPRRMTELLEKAAEIRVNATKANGKGNILSKLRSALETEEDESLINKYWERSQLDRITSDPVSKNVIDSSKNIFSAHPPFNLIIVYGLEEVALSPKSLFQTDDIELPNNIDNVSRMMLSDVNQRIIKSTGLSSPMKIVLQEINLMNMSAQYTPGGQPLVETYQFMARDHYFTEADASFIKQIISNNISANTKAVEMPPTQEVRYSSNWSKPLGRPMPPDMI